MVKGKIYDVVIDLRKNSKSYKRWIGIELTDENHRELYIPECFGHAYFALEDSFVSFKVTTHYIPGDEVGFAWNSHEFNIDWPVLEPIQNEADKNNPEFSSLLF